MKIPTNTLLAVLGYDISLTGPDSISSEAIDPSDLEEIKAYIAEFERLPPEEVEKMKKLYGELGGDEVLDYYDRLSEAEEKRNS